MGPYLKFPIIIFINRRFRRIN